jgi:hypothetical protein
MGTFQRTETVDARQFTGGLENGTNLALWVNEHGQLTETRAFYYEGIKETRNNNPEHIRVRTYAFRVDVYIGDWIILKQDGTFDVMRPQEFAASGFTQV